MILMAPVQLEIFYDSTIYSICQEQFDLSVHPAAHVQPLTARYSLQI